MKHSIKTVISLLAASALLFLLPVQAPADDTEVYVGSNLGNSSVRPNIVFIIDNSGSMRSTVEITPIAYDPSVTYTGPCSADRVYWWDGRGSSPTCSSDDWFYVSANRCDKSISALQNQGLYGPSRMAMWKQSWRARRSEWTDFSASWHDRAVECEADSGVHGDGIDTAKLWAADGSAGPWSSSSGNEVRWNRTGDNFTLYSANYMNWKETAGNTTMTRLEVVQQVFGNLIDTSENINVSVMIFNSSEGGRVLIPMQALTDANRASLKATVNALTPETMTPLSETLHEAFQYYRGGNVEYGSSGDASVISNGVYISPIEFQCQKNFIVLLTDGEPTYDTSSDYEIENLDGFANLTGASTCSGNCLDELAQYMYKGDCRGDMADRQNIITYTIGFQSNQQLLSDAASKGGGKYFVADDANQLSDAFTSILTEILAVNTTFVAPAVSVNAFNQLNHRSELYFALFRPNAFPQWKGNIKRYDISGNPATVKDVNGDLAVDPNTGFFSATSTSFWTPTADAPDGDGISKGGAASMIALPRNVYTTLSGAMKLLHENTSEITASMLGVDGYPDPSAQRTAVLQWARGVDVFDADNDGSTTDARREMGDPLHTQPVLITYGATETDADITLFTTNNGGYLHAIDTADGTEHFSFVPQDLLPLLNTLYENDPGDPHPYGLDGPMSALYDDNKNARVDSNESVWLYFGMRRGGRNYYALDVTDRSSPKQKWVIRGGSGDFTELGQTWSKATPFKVATPAGIKKALIFGGGYDPNQDGNALAEPDTMGRAIYIVDADTGAKLWQAGPPGTGADLVLDEMTNSIPSDVRVIDLNSDGIADRMFVGDMGGRLWRFDMFSNGLITGGVIANFSGTTAQENRRFYYPPELTMSKDASTLYIAIGSGYRSHPLDTTIEDAFFVVRDPYVYNSPIDANGNPFYEVVTLADLYDATENLIGEGSEAERAAAREALANSRGWYMWLNDGGGSFKGEKVLAQALIYNFHLVFTTFTPVGSASQSACAPSQGIARVYLLNLDDATAVQNFDGIGGEDRSRVMTRGGPPPQPTIVLPGGEDGSDGPVLMVGPEQVDEFDDPINVEKTFWQIGD